MRTLATVVSWRAQGAIARRLRDEKGMERAGILGGGGAANGRGGLRALYATAPDVVLLDVSMPDLDGWQTLERIRDLTDVPVLMLTARASELEKVRGLKAGADDYVTQPFGRP